MHKVLWRLQRGLLGLVLLALGAAPLPAWAQEGSAGPVADERAGVPPAVDASGPPTVGEGLAAPAQPSPEPDDAAAPGTPSPEAGAPTGQDPPSPPTASPDLSATDAPPAVVPAAEAAATLAPSPDPAAVTPATAAETAGVGVDGTVVDSLAAPPANALVSAGREPGRVLYADDFANPNSGWPRQASDPRTRRVGYGEGEYFVQRLPGSGGSPYVTRAERYGDFQVELDARLVEPTADAYLFLDFRRQDNGAHYTLVVTPDDGALTLRRHTERDGTPVIPWTRVPAIQPGAAWNRLGVRTRGAEIVLLVNGQEVGRVEDASLREGSLGFGVGHFEDQPAEGRFRNLVVTEIE